MTTYWHGSPYLITDDYVVPGAELKRDNYGMSRNRSVFVSRRIETAAGMGQPSWSHVKQPCAPYMYEVEPIGMYERDPYDEYEQREAPHGYLLGSEEDQCQRARILRRFRNIQPTQDEYERVHGPSHTWDNKPHYALLTQAVLEDV